jgi:hypothetical protein
VAQCNYLLLGSPVKNGKSLGSTMWVSMDVGMMCGLYGDGSWLLNDVAVWVRSVRIESDVDCESEGVLLSDGG